MTATPSPDAVLTSVLAHDGLMATKIGSTPAILPANSGTMLFGGVYEQTVTIQTSDNISSVFGTAIQFTDFQIGGAGTASQVDTFDEMYLEFTVSNNDGANALKLPPAWYAINSLQLQVSGNTVVQYQYSQQMEDMYDCRASRFEHNSNFAQLGYPDATFAATGITIPASTQRTFCVPVHHMFPEWMKVPLKSVGDNVTVRIYWNPGAGYYWSTSVSTNITCANIRIIAAGQQLDGSASMSLARVTDASVLKVPCIIPQVRPVVIGALAGTASAPVISNLQGACSQIRLWVYDSPFTTPESKQVTDTFSYWQFLNQSGAIVNLGAQNQFETLQWTASHFGRWNRVLPQSVGSSLVGAETLKYNDQGPSIFFCKEVAPVVSNTVRHGAYSLAGQEQFIVAGTYANGYALAFFYILGFLRLANGHITYEYQTR